VIRPAGKISQGESTLFFLPKPRACIAAY
jgi:hypothetical protein